MSSTLFINKCGVKCSDCPGAVVVVHNKGEYMQHCRAAGHAFSDEVVAELGGVICEKCNLPVDITEVGNQRFMAKHTYDGQKHGPGKLTAEQVEQYELVKQRRLDEKRLLEKRDADFAEAETKKKLKLTTEKEKKPAAPKKQ